LIKELNNFLKIEDPNQGLEFELFGEKYWLVETIMKERESIYQSSTYLSNLYVSTWLIQKKLGGGDKNNMYLLGVFP
jgi:DNA-directed RNA polymerase subunit beta